jgi:hypothetical protein
MYIYKTIVYITLPKMRIEIKRSGGYAGITNNFFVDEKHITGSEISQLKELLTKAKFFELPSNDMKNYGADYYIYDITVEMNGLRQTVKTTDISISQSLREIVKKVMEIGGRSSQS